MARRGLEVLWCGNGSGSNGWMFPPAVRRELMAMTAGRSVCHLFGGRASFGVRCDIDPIVRPDVLADAWLPPFRRDAFDVVILDPPYVNFTPETVAALFEGSAYIARDSVIWFHTIWAPAWRGFVPRRSWLVRVGDLAAARCLQVFDVKAGEKRLPPVTFSRGPAFKYNRWSGGQVGLFS